MLDAACPGEVFTSPTPDQMLEATKAVDGGAGVLHIVKNYTGDVLNFEMAADLAKGEGIEVEAVVTNDDVAVQDSLYTAGRRGVGITVIAEKICGAAAEEGKSLAEVAELCRKVNGQGRSMGMALTPCITPGSGEPSFELADDEMEIGIGIHGEPGRYREKLASGGGHRRAARDRDRRGPAVRVRRQGARVRQRHGRHAADRALHRLPRARRSSSSERGITIERQLIGNYITSLEMAGCSITLLKLDDELTRLWDAPVRHAGAARRLRRLSITATDVRDWIHAYAADDRRAPRRAGQARHGDRRRRPRHQHGPRHAQGGREARRRRRATTSARC